MSEYRYTLRRDLAPSGPLYCFIGVNPSTASDDTEDATTRKWNGFVRRWGGRGYVVVNLFAFRATDVRRLTDAADPVGPDNDLHIEGALRLCDVTVPCWGSSAKLPARLRPRIREVAEDLWLRTPQLRCLGLTNDGQPRHPLMLSYETPLETWS